MSERSLKSLFYVLQDIRTEYEMKGCNPFKYVLQDWESEEKRYHIRVMRNLTDDGFLRIDKKWWLVSISFWQYIKVEIFDSFFDLYNQVEKQLIALSSQEKSSIVSKEYLNWTDIKLRFMNEQDIKILHKEKEMVVTYDVMGFSDGRNKLDHEARMKHSWALLRVLAINKGFVSLKGQTKAQREKMKKQKQELSRILVQYFRINSDPIEYNKKSDAYFTKFKIEPEQAMKDDYRDRDIYDAVR